MKPESKPLFIWKWLYRLGLSILAIYLMICVYLYCCDQFELLTDSSENPDGSVEKDFEFVPASLVLKDDSSGPSAIHYRKYPAKSQPPKGTVYFLHGSKGNMDKCEFAIEPFLENGYDVWTMDYRGFGDSSGAQSEKALLNDAKDVYEKIKESGVSESDIVVWGRSFGSGVAAWVAAEGNPRMLVLETPYWSIPDAARSAYVLVPDVLFHYELPTHEYLKGANCRIELIHGTSDEKIPFSSSERLFLLCRDELNREVRSHAIMCAPHNLRKESQFEGIVEAILADPTLGTNPNVLTSSQAHVGPTGAPRGMALQEVPEAAQGAGEK